MMAEVNAQIVAPAAAAGQRERDADHPLRSLSGQTHPSMETHPAWSMISRLPVILSVKVPLQGFKVCHLLALRAGQTIGSSWAVTEDVPLKVGALQLCWGEFEVVEQRMALRLTRLA